MFETKETEKKIFVQASDEVSALSANKKVFNFNILVYLIQVEKRWKLLSKKFLKHSLVKMFQICSAPQETLLICFQEVFYIVSLKQRHTGSIPFNSLIWSLARGEIVDGQPTSGSTFRDAEISD